MAQVAEKKYPTAQHLLIADTDLVALAKYDEEFNTSLALATVTVEGRNGMTQSVFWLAKCGANDDSHHFSTDLAIKNRFGNGTASSTATGSILVTIDATSRSICFGRHCRRCTDVNHSNSNLWSSFIHWIRVRPLHFNWKQREAFQEYAI